MMAWKDVCSADDLQPDSGVCVLVAGQQVALFHMKKENAVYAIGNYDPIGKANVLSRGIIGDVKGEPVVASPLYKQHFSLNTGVCIEDSQISVPVYPIRIQNGRVEVQVVTAASRPVGEQAPAEASV
jgi:nitrite reductase (NADH) small subunit